MIRFSSPTKPAPAAIVAALLTAIAGLVPLLANPAAGPSRMYVYNLAPTFGDPRNDEIWDPNFIPGFNGTPGVEISWSAPQGGPGSIRYYVGPWANGSVAPYPHFGVGPQAFNFVEVPRTQVYRSPTWGDYTQVRQGFLACAVNLGNYTVDPASALHPVYIGMPETGVSWYLRLSLHWDPAVVTPGLPHDARLELVTTTTLPASPVTGYPELVYSELVLWSSAATSGTLVQPLDRVLSTGDVAGGVAFSVDQLPNQSVDRTYLVPLSSYLSSTLGRLGVSPDGALLSYVYLSAAGYNTHLSLQVSGLWVESPASLC